MRSGPKAHEIEQEEGDYDDEGYGVPEDGFEAMERALHERLTSNENLTSNDHLKSFNTTSTNIASKSHSKLNYPNLIL